MPSIPEQMMFFGERDDIELISPTCALSNSGKATMLSHACDCRKAAAGGVR
jgi:hypothetical protein